MLINFLLSVKQPNAPWEWLIINGLSFIENYGLRVVFLIVMLKLLLFPLDFFQRKVTADNARKMERMKPAMEQLQQQFGHDRQLLASKQRALQKQEKYNPFVACLPAIVTLVIFITLFSSFRICSNYYNVRMVESMYSSYSEYTIVTDERPKVALTLEELQEYLDQMYEADVEAGLVVKEEDYIALESELYLSAGNEDVGRGKIAAAKQLAGKQAALKVYEEEYLPFMRFLFVANVWQPDTYVDPIPEHKDVQASLNASSTKDVADKDEILRLYDEYSELVASKYNTRWNGFFIYVVLAVGLNFLQSFITTRQQKKANPSGDPNNPMGNMNMGKMMMFMMPLMMGYFAFIQPASFTLYIVVNSAMGILLNLLSTWILKIYEKKMEAKEISAVVNTGVRSVRGMTPKSVAKNVATPTDDKKKK